LEEIIDRWNAQGNCGPREKGLSPFLAGDKYSYLALKTSVTTSSKSIFLLNDSARQHHQDALVMLRRNNKT
jgi:hypothetical protein